MKIHIPDFILKLCCDSNYANIFTANQRFFITSCYETEHLRSLSAIYHAENYHFTFNPRGWRVDSKESGKAAALDCIEKVVIHEREMPHLASYTSHYFLSPRGADAWTIENLSRLDFLTGVLYIGLCRTNEIIYFNVGLYAVKKMTPVV